MEAKEKAKELVDRFYYSLPNNGSFTGINSIVSRYQEAKQCALIAVDDTLKEYSIQLHQLGLKTIVEYWQEVKQEIINL